MSIYNLELVKDKRYRVTQTDGKKWRGTFDGKFEVMGHKVLQFSWEHQIIDTDLISKIEDVEEIRPQTQAIKEGRFDEYKHYGTINGKTPRRQFIYTEVK